MNHGLDARLAGEIRAFALRFTCDACAHVRADGACSLGYPNDDHRRTEALDDAIAHAVEEGGGHTAARRVTFCKEFELG